jgi:predicted RNA-binding Zn ribbon-like protein
MTWAIDRTFPWLGDFPIAVDLANTVVMSGGREVDLLTSESELTTWIEAERARAPSAGAARGRLGEVRALRDAVRDLLFATAEGGPLPASAVAATNRAAALCPSWPVIDEAGRATAGELSDNPFDRFCSAVARSAVEVVGGPERDRLAVCHAPSCGMFFMRGNPRQTWCTPACGNRARVARHAARSSRPSARERTRPKPRS